MSKIDTSYWESVREDKKRQKRFKKRKTTVTGGQIKCQR